MNLRNLSAMPSVSALGGALFCSPEQVTYHAAAQRVPAEMSMPQEIWELNGADDDSRSNLEKWNFKLRLRIRQLEQHNRQLTRALVDVGDTNDQLRRIVRDVLEHEGVSDAEISLVFVADDEMHALNRRHLEHDYPTDVLSFLLDEAETETGRSIEAEIIVGTEYASRTAPQFGWSADDEVTLYVVHGLLHACGYDDLSPEKKRVMRRAEVVIAAFVMFRIVHHWSSDVQI